MDQRRSPDPDYNERETDANSENTSSGNPPAGHQADRIEIVSEDASVDSLASQREASPPKSKTSGELVEWIKALAVAGILVFLIRWFLVSPFIVDGPSMQPNFWNRERIIVNKIIYDIRQPKRGEVIVFHVPEEGRDFIKRVIGEPGDTVKVDGDNITINGEPLDETYLKKAYADAHAAGNLYNREEGFPNVRFPDGKVPEGMLFVMGDNRSNSEDSRMIGFIPLDRVVGRADLVYWPLADFHFVSH